MNTKPFIAGIVGGMGALAGVRLQELVIKHTPARRDQEQVPVLCFTNPAIPDRTAALSVGKPELFVEPVVKTARLLVEAGAEKIYIPCNTTHMAYRDIQAGVSVPVYHLIDETVAMLEGSGKKKLVILATPFVAKSVLYESKQGSYELIRPDEAGQQKVMDLIYKIKGNDFAGSKGAIGELLERYAAEGADGYILGCTELSLLYDVLAPRWSVFDPLEVAAKDIVSEYLSSTLVSAGDTMLDSSAYAAKA